MESNIDNDQLPPRYSFAASRDSLSPEPLPVYSSGTPYVNAPGSSLQNPEPIGALSQLSSKRVRVDCQSDGNTWNTLLHLYKSAMTSKFTMFDANKKSLLYTAVKVSQRSKPIMFKYRGGEVQDYDSVIWLCDGSGGVQMSRGSRYPVLRSKTSSSQHCTHSWTRGSQTFIWQSKDPPASQRGLPRSARRREHDVVLMNDQGVQLAEFCPFHGLLSREIGTLQLSHYALSQGLQDEIAVGLIALRRFTCCCCYIRGACIPPANVNQPTLFDKSLN